MACLDTSRALSGASGPAIPSRESKSRTRACAATLESSRSLLHHLVSSAALGIFCFGFRARILFLLVCQDFCVGPGAGLVSSPATGELRARLIRRIFGFSYVAMVAVVS